MIRRSRAFWAGSFVILGTVIGVALLIWLGVQNWFQESVPYVTYFDVSVQGLNIDSDVKFSGIPVGRVSAIELAEDDYLIEVQMELDPEFTVRDSLRAKLGITGITGMKYIELNYVGEEKRDEFPKLSFETPYPVIPSYPAGFEELEQALKDIYEKIMVVDTDGISYRTKEFLETGTKTMQTIDRLAADPRLVDWTEKWKETLARADTTLMAMERTILALNTERFNAQLDTTMQDLREGATHFNGMFANMEKETENLNLAVRADSLYDEINQVLLSSARLVQQSQYNTTQMVNQLNSTIAELNKAIEHMNSLIMSMEQYPSNWLFTAPPGKEK